MQYAVEIEKIAVANGLEKLPPTSDIITYLCPTNSIVKILENFKKSPELRFTILSDLFATDFLPQEKRFEVVYNLLSLKLNSRLILKIKICENEKIPSVSKIFKAACWYEREIYDMYGIEFNNASDLRRILTDYNFVGHPLRKDFPLTGYVEVKYDEKQEKVVYQDLQLEQDYRDFDFISSWQGPDYILPGDEKAKK